MIRLDVALTALASIVAIAPYVDVVSEIDNLNQATVNPEIIRFGLRTADISEATLSIASAALFGIDAVRREQPDQTATDLKQQLSENSTENTRLELITIEF